MTKITESESFYNNIEKMEVDEILSSINNEDAKVHLAVKECLPQISALVEAILPNFKLGGRIFYIGAGTSGRLGIVDASECPPTFGIEHGRIVGLIAGGDTAIRKAVEFAEDDVEQGWNDLQLYQLTAKDAIIGIAASGTTPYVLGAIQKANTHKITTGCITNNLETPLAKIAQYPIECVVGAEFITGSTRMKSGTAQKLILNMLSTTLLIKLGRVKGNKMVDMQLTNNKLVDRGTKIIMASLGISYDEAKTLLNKYGNVRDALNAKI